MNSCFQISTVTFENVCRVTYETFQSKNVEPVQYVYHCCLFLIFDQTTNGPRTKVFAISSTSSALLDESGTAAIENAVLLLRQTKFTNYINVF